MTIASNKHVLAARRRYLAALAEAAGPLQMCEACIHNQHSICSRGNCPCVCRDPATAQVRIAAGLRMCEACQYGCHDSCPGQCSCVCRDIRQELAGELETVC